MVKEFESRGDHNTMIERRWGKRGTGDASGFWDNIEICKYGSVRQIYCQDNSGDGSNSKEWRKRVKQTKQM